jgi:DNA polymerase III delta subunit
VLIIGTYSQWRASVDGGDLRRVTWVAGDQPVLIEEVVDTLKKKLEPSSMDYVSLSFSSTFDRDVWAEANQYPLTPGANRLVLVRDADRLTRWQQLENWLARTRSLPGVYLLFVSNEDDLPWQTVAGKRVLKPHVAQIRAPRGSLVRCTQLSEPDALAWVRRRARLDEDAAKYLLTRTGGNLSQAAAVCSKLALFEQGAGAATINALVAASPSHEFPDHLIALEKREALLCLPSLTDSARIKLVALLDSRLDLLEKLHRIQIAGRSWREASGVNPFLLRQYMPHARHYDVSSCTHRRRILAVIDDALRNGARDGVFEALVALW